MTIDQLIAKWLGRQGGGERAEYQHFLTEFAQALAIPVPGDPGFAVEDFRFEAPVRSEAIFGGKGTKRIDLYKRDCFVLEAKQSREDANAAPPRDEPEPVGETLYDLFGAPIGIAAPKAGKRHRYDKLMSDARLQAERYALALPVSHRAPPFIIIADIRKSFELYFDYGANGRGYAPFPDERRYRIGLADLADPAPLPGVGKSAADVLRAVWTDPASIDPRLRAAEVTREIAERLSQVAKQLETDQRGHHAGDALVALGIEATSLFLMRMLFCMFAEDVELLPKDSFKRFLEEAKDKSDTFWRRGIEDLWSRMNDPSEANRYWSFGDAFVRYFNGNLFSNVQVFDVSNESKARLLDAAGKDWRAVEPAIFGTLLEQVLTTADRAKLGAHYTPRAYVERLVEATILDVLRPEWEQELEKARAKIEAGDRDGAIGDARAFHRRLCAVHVLDPACGTANFLYVAMEQLLRLEGEVRVFAAGLGEDIAPEVHPNQFLGLELNPRAAVIAELVLWIGWLRYRLANSPEAIKSPVLPPLSNINGGTHGGFDALLTLTETGQPDLDNPRRPPWPETDFIVGNPPFIGGKDIRARLGGDYAEALWRANPGVPKSAVFVMHWWDRAAALLTAPGTRLRRFGFVTTNSITQVFSRRVIEKWLAPLPSPLAGSAGVDSPRLSTDRPGDDRPADGDSASAERGEGPAASAAEETPSDRPPQGISAADGAGPSPRSLRESPSPARGEGKLHLTLAIPDHPWTRVTKDAAAVRIAMTVAEAGAGTGKRIRITGERALDTDAPELEEAEDEGIIHADLTVGTNVTSVVPLKANAGLCSPGVKLHGAGFIVTPERAKALGLGTRPGLDRHIRHYRNGRDLLQRPRGVMVIDLFGLSEDEVMDRFPEVYQHLLQTVRSDRQKQVDRSPTADAKAYRDKWWIFGKARTELRPALATLGRYIATTETSKHRIFQFIDGSVIADNMAVVLASDDPFYLGVLSSRIHSEWALDQGGTLEDRPRWSKSRVYDPFPFPNGLDEANANIKSVAEHLDATRKAALAENPTLTMTGLYNLVAAIRDGTLPPSQEQQAVRARARIVAKLHDDLDQAVADAYGWGEQWRRAPLPPAEIVARLVALNATRAAEEKAGHIRWLRPDYQIPRFGKEPLGDTLRE